MIGNNGAKYSCSSGFDFHDECVSVGGGGVGTYLWHYKEPLVSGEMQYKPVKFS